MRGSNPNLLAGAIAGLVATGPMTAVMRALWEKLPEGERYPAPPREIIDRTTGGAQTATLLAHFGYGALCGAVFAASGRRSVAGGVLFGLGVWGASYLGFLPSLGVLRCASTHPLRRNAMMLAAHATWGAATALACKDLERAAATIFEEGPARDAPYADRSSLAGSVKRMSYDIERPA
jgi:hypothetical protein